MFREFLTLAAIAALASCATEKRDAADVLWSGRTLDGKPPLIIAHRGASGYLPEHTLAAYRLAIEQGADVIEPDLVFTRDGVLVARHDRYLSTTTDVANYPQFAERKRVDAYAAASEGITREDWWIEDFIYEELRVLRARQPRDGRPKEYDGKFEIPTFADILALVTTEAAKAGRPVGVYPETKHPGFFASISRDFEAPLLEALASFDAGPVFIQSFEPEILKRLKGRTTAKLVQLVYEETPGAGPNISLEEIATYADGVGPSKELVLSGKKKDTGLVGKAHDLGLFVHAWTFRDDVARKFYDPSPYSLQSAGVYEPTPPPQKLIVQELDLTFETGVDGVFADFPDTALRIRVFTASPHHH